MKKLIVANQINGSSRSHSGYRYITKHGLGPGMIPKDVDILDWEDLDNWKTAIIIDRPLTKDELEYYDIYPEYIQECETTDIVEDENKVYSTIAVVDESSCKPGRCTYRLKDKPTVQYTLTYHVDDETDDVRGQVVRVTPYDDADYYWAKFSGDGRVKLIQNGRIKSNGYLGEYDPEWYENIDEWFEDTVQEIISMLEEYNSSIKPKMIHN